MPKLVLDVGNCVPDHAAIRGMIESNFDAKVLQADNLTDALSVLEQQQIELVLVNRKLDVDYSDGLAVIHQIKANEQHRETPVMMITNYEDHQELAVAAGAVKGFGKLALSDAATLETLRAFLA